MASRETLPDDGPFDFINRIKLLIIIGFYCLGRLCTSSCVPVKLATGFKIAAYQLGHPPEIETPRSYKGIRASLLSSKRTMTIAAPKRK